VFLSVLFNVLPRNVGTAFAGAQGTPEFQAALRADPTQADLLRQAQGGEALNDTSFLSRLSDVVSHPFKVGFSDSVSTVFLLAAAIMVIGLVVVFFLPEVPLSDRSAAAARAEEDAAIADAAGPGAPPASVTTAVAPDRT
jgi:hypothetical protein